MKITLRPKSTPALTLEQRLEIINSPVYPLAIPDHFICNSDDDHYMRAYSLIHAFVPESVEKKRFFIYPEDKYVLEEAKLANAILEPPYDIIVIYDVLDHCEENPITVLKSMHKMLAPEGKIYIRCHPWCARHCAHLYRTINKAFIHLFLSPQEIYQAYKVKSIHIRKMSNNPFEMYYDWFNKSNLKAVAQNAVLKQVEPIFHQFKMRKIIFTDELISLMNMEFIDFVCTRKDFNEPHM